VKEKLRFLGRELFDSWLQSIAAQELYLCDPTGEQGGMFLGPSQFEQAVAHG
jgi:hypothetical protein